MISDKERAEIREAAKRYADAMPPLTAEQVAFVCEMFEPLTPEEIAAHRARKAQTTAD
jgi:hypothetical protein